MSTSLKRYNLLIVEDEPVAAELLKGQLGSVFTVETASTGHEALLRLSLPKPIHVMTLDLGLPCGRGEEVFNRFHDSYPYLPIIIITSTFRDYRSRYLSKGASAFFVKPPNMNDLVDAIIDAAATHDVQLANGDIDICLTAMKMQAQEALAALSSRVKAPSSVKV